MPELTIKDAGRQFVVQFNAAVDDGPILSDQPAPHLRFIKWWKKQCEDRGIPYQYGVAEPQGIRIIKQLLRTHGYEELQIIAVRFFLDHGSRIRTDPNHFAIFTSMVEVVKQELAR